MKIAFVGAGSVVFTKNLLADTFDFPELHGATIALHDIDAERLQTAGMMARWTSEQLGAHARAEEHPDLRGALEGPSSSSTWSRSGCTRRPCWISRFPKNTA